MSTTERAGRIWTADAFLRTDQSEFGSAWRYELVEGRIVAHAAPSPDHGAIAANLAIALGNRLRSASSGCRVEVGSGAAPKSQQRASARIPDVSVRCGEHPRVVFEVVSPSALVRLAPSAIPQITTTIGAALITAGPGTFLTATGAALGRPSK